MTNLETNFACTPVGSCPSQTYSQGFNRLQVLKDFHSRNVEKNQARKVSLIGSFKNLLGFLLRHGRQRGGF